MLLSDFDRSSAAELVKSLAQYSSDQRAWVSEFIETAIERLLTEPRWADDLRPVCRLVENCAEVFPEGTTHRVEEAISNVADSIASGKWDLDADALREEAATLESLAEDLGIDIHGDLDTIRERADELEQETGREDEQVDFSSSEPSSNKVANDDDIASMFSMLDVHP